MTTNMTTNTNTDTMFIDFNDLKYSPIKAHSSGSKVIRLMQAICKENLRVNTPVMLTWGASEILDSQSNPTGKWSMSLQFPEGEYSNTQTDKFYDEMKQLQQKIKEDVLANSLQWLGKDHKLIEIIDALANPMLKVSKIKKPDGSDKMPTMTIKIPCYDGKWTSEIFDEDAVTVLYSSSRKDNIGKIPPDYLQKMARVACEIECSGIWFSNGKYSISWQLVQARVMRSKVREQGICRLTLTPEEQEAANKLPPLQEFETHPIEAQKNDCAVLDTDDEDDDETENVLPPAPPAAVLPPAPAPPAPAPPAPAPPAAALPTAVPVDESPDPTVVVNVKPKPKVRAKPK